MENPDPKKEEKKEESKEEKKQEEAKKEEPEKEKPKEEPKKEEEKKEEKKEEVKVEEKKEDKKDKEEADDKKESEAIVKSIDKKIGIQNMAQDKDIKSEAKTWDDLGVKENIKKGLLEMDFIEPSKIQSISFPLIMKEPRYSVIAQAKNGSGKTGAFGLGVISSIDENSKDIQAVILGLTRELIIQIKGVLEQMTKNTNIKITQVLKDEEPKEYGQIVVITPVYFETWFLKKNKNAIKNLKMMVLDEADEIIKNETTWPAVKRAFTIFQKEKMKVQVLFFSATFNNYCLKQIKGFYNTVYMIELKKEELTLEKVTQLYQECRTPEEKIDFINKYLEISEGSQRAIIFVNTRDYVLKLKEKLGQKGRRVFILMGKDMNPKNRDETIRRFRNGDIHVLITTNVLARGYDERSVKLVINFDLPVRKLKDGSYEPDYESYLHRIGRTGRFGTEGIGLNLCCAKYDYVNLQKIEKFYKTKIEKMKSLDELMEQLKKLYIDK